MAHVDPSLTQTNSLFITGKEIDFFNSISKEIIQKIVAQKIIYYAVSIEHSQVNELYNESITKTVYSPVEMNALILFNEPIETTTHFSIDTVFTLEIYFLENELRERNVEPREGDFIRWHDKIYEIKTLTRPQIFAGQIENPVMLKATAHIARESNFVIMENKLTE